MAVGVVGIVGTTAYTTVDEPSLRQGQSVRVHDYDVTLRGVSARSSPQYEREAAPCCA